MISEYMNNLYRDLLSNSPQTVTIPIPSDMGTGQNCAGGDKTGCRCFRLEDELFF